MYGYSSFHCMYSRGIHEFIPHMLHKPPYTLDQFFDCVRNVTTADV